MFNFLHKILFLIKSNKKSFKDYSAVGATRFIQKALGLVLIYFITTSISVADYGRYNFILSILAVLSIFTLSGLSNAITQSVSRGFEMTYLTSIKYSLSGSLISSICLVAIGAYYYFIGDLVLSVSLVCVAALTPFVYGISNWKSLLTGREEFLKLSYVTLFADIVKTALLVLLLTFTTAKLHYIFAIMFLIPSAVNLFQTIILSRTIDRTKEAENHSLAYGIKTTLYASINIVANRVDAILIFSFLSPVALGVYALSERISEVVKEAINDIGLILTPKFAKSAHFGENLKKAVMYISLVFVAALRVFTFILLPMIMPALFGPDYDQSLPIAQILLLSIAFITYHNLKFKYILSQLDVSSFRDFNLISNIARIGLSCALIPIYGLYGAVLSTVLYRLVCVFYVEYIFRTKYKKVPQ